MKSNLTTIVRILIIALLIAPLSVHSVEQADIDSKQSALDKLQSKIDKRQKNYSELQDKVTVYKENIKSKQQEALTLESQLEVLDANIGRVETEKEATENKIEELDASIEILQIEINDTEVDVDDKKDQIGDLIVELHRFDNQTYLERLAGNNTLSEVSASIQYTESVNSEFKSTLNDLQDLKAELQEEKIDLKDNREDQKEKKVELVVQEETLSSQIAVKENLKTEVEEDEEKFKALVAEIQAEQAEINSSLTTLEKSARKTLDELTSLKKASNPAGDQDTNTNTSTSKPITLPTEFNPDWPVRGVITTTFRDPAYIYRRYFQHDAIDIASSQGTPVKAADSGVVAITKFDGTPNFAYVTIVHPEGYSTMYAHVSAIYVEPEQVVEKGQTIAAVGGTPGTPGAGKFTTGPHVHFGVRLNNIPVDPLLYLP